MDKDYRIEYEENRIGLFGEQVNHITIETKDLDEVKKKHKDLLASPEVNQETLKVFERIM